MPELEACQILGAIYDDDGQPLGEARLWAAGERGPEGAWTGWVRAADLGGKILPGRYTVITPHGWQADFEIVDVTPRRVFETDLIAVAGVGPVPWPDESVPAATSETEARPSAPRDPM